MSQGYKQTTGTPAYIQEKVLDWKNIALNLARERISMSERRTLESSRWSIRWLRRTTSWLPVPSPLGFVLGSSAESCSAVLVFCVAWTPCYWGRLLRFREISGSWSFLATGYSHYGAVCWDLQQWIVIVLVILTLDPIIAYIYICKSYWSICVA